MLVNILGITDDAKCYELVRHLRCPTATPPGWSSKARTTPSHNGSGMDAAPAGVGSMT